LEKVNFFRDRSIDRITFFRNSFFSFEFHSFELANFFLFFLSNSILSKFRLGVSLG
jgi:hypothetical protein